MKSCRQDMTWLFAWFPHKTVWLNPLFAAKAPGQGFVCLRAADRLLCQPAGRAARSGAAAWVVRCLGKVAGGGPARQGQKTTRPRVCNVLVEYQWPSSSGGML